MIHLELCKKLKFEHITKWYMHKWWFLVENATHQILWEFERPTIHLSPIRRPDQGIVTPPQKKKKKRKENLPNCRLCRLGRPKSENKRKQKIDKYLNLAREMKKLWIMKVTAVSIVIGALRMVPSGLVWQLEELEIEVQASQTTTLLRSARILRRVLDTCGD